MEKTFIRSLLYATLFVASMDVALIALYDVPFLRNIPAVFMLPGALAIFSWAPIHYTWAIGLMQIVNVLFYYAVFLLGAFVRNRLRSR